MTHPTWAEHLETGYSRYARDDIVFAVATPLGATPDDVDWALRIARRDPHKEHTVVSLRAHVRDLLYMRSRFC